jgi:hypothetical protein
MDVDIKHSAGSCSADDQIEQTVIGQGGASGRWYVLMSPMHVEQCRQIHPYEVRVNASTIKVVTGHETVRCPHRLLLRP